MELGRIETQPSPTAAPRMVSVFIPKTLVASQFGGELFWKLFQRIYCRKFWKIILICFFGKCF